MNVLAFDIETVPDVCAGRAAYGLDGLCDEDVARALVQRRIQENGTDFLRLNMHRIVAISVVLRAKGHVRVWSLGQVDSSESELIERFYEGLERYSPRLVSWNGSGFDLPVLHYRSLLHGVCAPRYWEGGDAEREFRWNNYRNRYHERHTDLMDVLSMFQARAAVPLDDLAATLGLPGKMGMHGSQVWRQYVEGDVEGIRGYCETDALNTYLLYLRFELIRGNLLLSSFREECQQVRDCIQNSNRPHWEEFLANWRSLNDWCHGVEAAPASGEPKGDGTQTSSPTH